MLYERHNPVGQQDYLSQQHLARYIFACKYISPGMKVLDIACGAGYGSSMMRDIGCEVTGGDYDEDILIEAKNNWPSVEFIRADAMDLPFENGCFDAVVSFETIEHVNDGELFLAEMKRVLKPEGIFICSTPNIRYTSHPSYHVREYTPDEYFDLLKNNFSRVDMAGQYYTLTDRLHDLVKWSALPQIAWFIRVIGLKPILKSVINKFRLQTNIAVKTEIVADQQKKQPMVRNREYDVVPIEPGGYRLLRIMVAVTTNQ